MHLSPILDDLLIVSETEVVAGEMIEELQIDEALEDLPNALGNLMYRLAHRCRSDQAFPCRIVSWYEWSGGA